MRDVTRRQEIAALLRAGERGFEELRRLLELPVRLLEQDLRHIEKSARAEGARLRVEPARCRDCGFTFRGREARHLHTPGRCPRCRSQRIDEPRFSIG